MARIRQDQEILRHSCNTYVIESGIKANYIANHCNFCPTVLSRFRRGKLNLTPRQYVALAKYLLENK